MKCERKVSLTLLISLSPALVFVVAIPLQYGQTEKGEAS
jgi:hypothetical protein